jgi:hypothetical protein
LTDRHPLAGFIGEIDDFDETASVLVESNPPGGANGFISVCDACGDWQSFANQPDGLLQFQIGAAAPQVEAVPTHDNRHQGWLESSQSPFAIPMDDRN